MVTSDKHNWLAQKWHSAFITVDLLIPTSDMDCDRRHHFAVNSLAGMDEYSYAIPIGYVAGGVHLCLALVFVRARRMARARVSRSTVASLLLQQSSSSPSTRPLGERTTCVIFIVCTRRSSCRETDIMPSA
jgi:hypothetical protein